ncbi:glutamate racemase [Trinickia diaoshuihuensis]|uniref:glutamate racemase n=1 Tax=Trinickia diaoshuihuensis TaxID=2292265 RepID=UPI001F075AC0|nr:glutamate racemase [Trinickia diaoshuihuensis]
MTTHDAPIGVFDSGLGGLSVLDAMRSRLPNESMVYIADSGYAPYGEKTDAFIRQRSKAIADWLVARGAKVLVVACNTATTHAIRHLRDTLSIPIVGVEPGIKPAALATVSGVVGVLATAATLRSERLKTLIAEHETQCRFVCQAGHGLVEQIEQGNLAGAVIDDLLTRYLAPMAQAEADTVILGSTHYALLAPSIRRLFGERFRLIETGPAIARRVETLLAEHGLAARADVTATGEIEYFSTAQSAHQREALVAVVSGLRASDMRPSVSYVEIAHAVTEPQH